MRPPLRVAVAGKGGAGKSVVAGTLARLLAQRGERVLVLDSDLMPGLALSLGADQPAVPPLLEAAERGADERWRLRKGIGPVRAVQRFSTEAPDGIRLLQCGKVTAEGLAPLLPALHAYYAVIHRLRRAASLRAWAFVADLPAGPRQTAFDWAPYADTFVVLVEPTWKSVLTARRIARIANARGRAVCFVASKIVCPADRTFVSRAVATRLLGAVPHDPEVAAAERLGIALVDYAPRSPSVRSIARIADALAGGHA